MTAKPQPMHLIPLFALILLTACSHTRTPTPTTAAPVKPVITTSSQPEPIRSAAPGSIRRRLIDLASAEWQFFGKQLVRYELDEESIPHVGAWEDDDLPHVQRVNDYWRAVHKPGLDGNDCRQPWSAAFISWLMANADVPDGIFPPAAAHWAYLAPILARAGQADSLFQPHPIGRYKPQAGDLVCASREDWLDTDANEIPPRELLEGAKLHCDLVVGQAGDRLEVIGGNVRNSVSKSQLPLDAAGHVQPTRTRRWILVIENRLY